MPSLLQILASFHYTLFCLHAQMHLPTRRPARSVGNSNSPSRSSMAFLWVSKSNLRFWEKSTAKEHNSSRVFQNETQNLSLGFELPVP
jgi:hypothetical protein